MHLAAVNPNCTDAPSSFVRYIYARLARDLADRFKASARPASRWIHCVYRITVYEIFEQQGVEVNARYAKSVPWRRTDVRMPYGCANCPCTGI